MSESMKNPAVAAAPAAPYTEPVSGERAATGRIPWWRDARHVWVPVACIFVIQMWSLQREIGGLRGEVATQAGEILALRAEMATLRAEMATLRAEMATENARLRAELQQEMARLRAELQREMAALRADLQEQIGELGQRITRLETLLEPLIEDYRSRNQGADSSVPGGP